ncbi:outer membrane lipoprotein chaperone LolA [Seleniivibrio woodruffii]|uniref:Outer-membrane lipoprotein carrier protein n=1 Tax=Seleniivibrio woodruffii TaxID=1078050 RepID=A0A4V2PRZ6_9BACT|nr:outer membrane lipoprotein chaperone LolA [Seleniivibrio woodruffii]TCK60031.1 outer membrane lipoprotein carrier protein [Seleniivibrio woodruffii]TVZ35748.1 outer membrane lipoprotein carrier protein [Seleniivibrio woodruffii]
MKKLIFIMVMMISAVCYADSVADVLAQLDKIKSYSADFTQKTELEGFGADTYSGRLYIKSRTKALWDYQKPYRQFYLFDTKMMQFYDSETKQLIKQKLDPTANAFMRLMLSPADMKKDFNVAYNESTGRLTLTPAVKNSGINAITFTVKNGLVTGITTKDQNGNNTSILLTNVKADPEIAESVFSLSVPKDTQIFNQ